jgi:hypothetical protein
LPEVTGNALGAVPDVLKGEIIGDNGAPAIGAELDGIVSDYLGHPRNK